MISLSMLWVLCPLIFLAAMVDAIAGGGGLISLTAYTACGLPPTMALGNNKFSSTCGTTLAVANYVIHREVDWKVAITTGILSLVGSLIGSRLALHYQGIYLKYMLLFIVPILTFLTLRKHDFGHARECPHLIPLSMAVGLSIGCYDGFFGPGTGMFLTWIFTGLMGLDILKAVGTTKVVNLASNVAALLTFARNGNIDYRIGFPCAACSLVGGYVGSVLAMKGGSKVVRPMLVLVLALLLLKVVSDLFF